MKQKQIKLILFSAILAGMIFSSFAKYAFAVNFSVAQADKKPPQGQVEEKKPPLGNTEKCEPNTGRIWIDDACECPDGLEEETEGNPKSKCILSNPAPGILVGTRSFDVLLKKFIDIALYFAGGIAVLFLIIGGFRYVTSLGNEEAMEKAKKTITSAVLGIIIIVMAFALVAIINTLLTKEKEEQTGKTTNSQGNQSVTEQSSGTGLQITSPPSSRVFYYSVGGGGNPIDFFASNCPPQDCRWTFTGLRAWLYQVPTDGGNSLQGAVDSASEVGKEYTFTAQAKNTKTGKSSPVQSYKIEITPGALNNP